MTVIFILLFLLFLCGQAELSLQSEECCKTQPSMWNFAYMFVAENACANPQEVRIWPFLPLRKKWRDSPKAQDTSSGEGALAWALSTAQLCHPLAGRPEAGLARANQRDIQLITSDSGQEQMLKGEYRNREKRTALLPGLQGCPEESFLSWLPPGHSACPSPSHQSSWSTDQQAKEDPMLIYMPLFLLIYFPKTLMQRRRGRWWLMSITVLWRRRWIIMREQVCSGKE